MHVAPYARFRGRAALTAPARAVLLDDMSKPPVLLVHGIWDSAARIDCLRAGLAARGVDRARAFDLVPNDGRASIERLAAQLDAAVESTLAGAPGGAVDVVGFSMGALVSRFTSSAAAAERASGASSPSRARTAARSAPCGCPTRACSRCARAALFCATSPRTRIPGARSR